MLKKMGISLLGCFALAILVMGIYGLISGVGYIGEFFSDAEGSATNSLFNQGADMLGNGCLFGMFAATMVLGLVGFFTCLNMLGHGVRQVAKMLFSKPKKMFT